jgi:hypothetical protein
LRLNKQPNNAIKADGASPRSLSQAFDGSSRAKSRRLQREYREHGAEPPKSLSMQPFAGQSAVASVGEIAVLPCPKFRMLRLIRRTARYDQLPQGYPRQPRQPLGALSAMVPPAGAGAGVLLPTQGGHQLAAASWLPLDPSGPGSEWSPSCLDSCSPGRLRFHGRDLHQLHRPR